MPTVTLPQGTIHYREDGPSDGPVALFVHGVIAAGDLWDPVVDRLAANGWRCLAPTWPLGTHPEPMKPGTDLSPEGIARIVHAFVRELGLRDVTLVGNDSGGAFSQFTVDHDPAPFAQLVLTNCDGFEAFPAKPFGIFATLAKRRWTWRAMWATMRFGAGRNLTYAILTRKGLPAAKTGSWWAPYFADEAVSEDGRRVFAALEPGMLVPVSERLKDFPGPVVLPWAVNDRFFTEKLGRRLAAAAGDARFVPIRDARTFVMWDQPQAVADAILETSSDPRGMDPVHSGNSRSAS